MNMSRHANAIPWKTMIILQRILVRLFVLNTWKCWICVCAASILYPQLIRFCGQWSHYLYLCICIFVYLCICVYLTPPTDPSLWTVIALWGWVGYLGDTCCLIFLHIFKTDQITKVEKAVFTAHNMWLKCITYMSTISVSHMEKKTKRTRALAGALYAVMCSSSSGATPNYALKVKIPFDCEGYSTFTPTRNASWSWWYLNVVFVSTLSVSVSA